MIKQSTVLILLGSNPQKTAPIYHRDGIQESILDSQLFLQGILQRAGKIDFRTFCRTIYNHTAQYRLTNQDIAVIIGVEKVLPDYGQPLQTNDVIAVLVRVPAVTSFLPE